MSKPNTNQGINCCDNGKDLIIWLAMSALFFFYSCSCEKRKETDNRNVNRRDTSIPGYSDSASNGADAAIANQIVTEQSDAKQDAGDQSVVAQDSSSQREAGQEASWQADSGQVEASIDDGDGSVSLCGNGILDPGEECDGPVPDFHCGDTLAPPGSLGCSSDCRFDICTIPPPPDSGGYIPPCANNPDPPKPWPEVTDFGEKGVFDVVIENNTGPNSAYDIYRPNPLGQECRMHPIIEWFN